MTILTLVILINLWTPAVIDNVITAHALPEVYCVRYYGDVAEILLS